MKWIFWILLGLLHPGFDEFDEMKPANYTDALAILADRNQPEDKMLRIGTLAGQGNYTQALSELNDLTGTTDEIVAYKGYMTAVLASGSDLMNIPDANYATAKGYTDEVNTSALAMSQGLAHLREGVYHPLVPIADGGESIGELAYSGSTLFMTGYTASATNFPLIDPGDPAYFQDIPGLGSQDAFIAGLNVEDVYITEVVNEEFSSPPLNVAPNPSSGKVILSMSQRAQNSINVRITDTAGRIIYQSTYELKRNNSLSLDLSFLSPGLYFAQLTDGDYYYHTK
jgi:hypothetical protein